MPRWRFCEETENLPETAMVLYRIIIGMELSTYFEGVLCPLEGSLGFPMHFNWIMGMLAGDFQLN